MKVEHWINKLHYLQATHIWKKNTWWLRDTFSSSVLFNVKNRLRYRILLLVQLLIFFVKHHSFKNLPWNFFLKCNFLYCCINSTSGSWFIYHTCNLVITYNQVKVRKMHFLKMNIIFNSRTTEMLKVQCSFLFLWRQCHFLGNYSSFLLLIISFNTWKWDKITVFYHYFSMSTWKCHFL